MGLLLPTWAVPVATAATVEAPPEWIVTTPGGPFSIRGDRPPLTLLAPEDRTCRVGLAWTPEGTAVVDRGCPEPIRELALRAVSGWRISAPAGATARQELGEVWFVYPYESGHDLRVLVLQDPGHGLVLPPGVDAVPFAVRAWAFLRYPPEAHAEGRLDVTCWLRVEADPRGVATRVTVDDCPEPFRTAAHDTVAAWRFEPPLVHGQAIPSALALSATFSAGPPEAPARTPAPGEDRRQLWRDRQFDQLTRDERLWFIQATLLGDPGGADLGPGHVRFRFPSAPDLGGRAPIDWFVRDRDAAYDPPPPLPEHPPILVLGEPGVAGIEVYTLALPEPGEVPGAARGTTCALQVQVDGQRQVYSWAEGCADEARLVATAFADRWVLRHEGPPRGDVRKRFRAELVFAEDGATRIRLDADQVRSPRDALPDRVSTWREPKATTRVPPRLPRGESLPEGDCLLEVALDARGRITEVTPVSCPADFAREGVRTVRRWRFSPAEDDGVPVASRTRVTIRFR